MSCFIGVSDISDSLKYIALFIVAFRHKSFSYCMKYKKQKPVKVRMVYTK